MPSIIIPAHNEEAVIERTLRGVLTDAVKDLEVVVVVNASTDATADIARSVDPGINVLETQTPGKCNALNLGEATLASFPRVFLDADIQLLPGSLSKLLNASGPDRPIVSPSPRFDLSEATLGMRLFYRAQRFNPYFGHGAPNGSGCFVLTEDARARWAAFPEIVADDGFVQGQFKPNERTTVSGAEAIVQPPRDVGSMITVRTRVRRGGYELARRFPELMVNHVRQGGGIFKQLLVRPWEWPAMVVYGYVRIMERIIARRQIAAGETGWGRDETGRQSN